MHIYRYIIIQKSAIEHYVWAPPRPLFIFDEVPVIWEWEQTNENDPLDYLEVFDVESNDPERLESELEQEDDGDTIDGDTIVWPKSTEQI